MIISYLPPYSLIVLLLTTLSLKKNEGVQGQRIPGGVDHHLNRTNSLDVSYSSSDSLYIARSRRQLDDESRGLSATSTLTCDFGSSGNLDLCSWYLPEDAHPNVRWKTGSGSTAYWLGGPLTDKTADDAAGGYVYFETSYKAVNRVVSSAALEGGGDLRIQVMDDLPSSLTSSNIGFHSANNINNSTSSALTSASSASSTSIFKSGLSVSNLDDSLSSLLIVPNTAHIISTNISVTGPQGNCLTFFYNLDGLSAEKLRIMVKDLEADFNSNQTLWETSIESEGKWIRASVAYAYETTHQLIMEGVAKSVDEPERAYRGYISVDDVSLQPMAEAGGTEGACHGHCTFEGGMCGWTNQEEGDDFDWTLARGSDNFFTGPARDFYSFSKEYPLGGFIYIDAGFPRRPGDRALLLSPTFEGTGENQAVCFKFATHMFGNGIGTLRVWFRPSGDAGEGAEGGNSHRVLWEMNGDSGNNWNMAQLPIASASGFQIAFEGIVGSNYLGNIAIDSISLEPGSCPISPQTASRKSGDCTFEENMCFWTNPSRETNLDDFDWIRQFSYGNFGPKRDHSKNSELGYFMSLNGDNVTPKRGGTNAWLVSGEFPVSAVKKCMQFYYFMYQRVIDPGGPSLGGLRIYIRTTDNNNNVILIPVWRLNNHQSMKWRKASVTLHVKDESGETPSLKKPPSNPFQVVIEGIWGDARVGSIALDDISFVDSECTTTPVNAVAVEGECSFDRNLCGWRNLTKRSSPNPLLSPSNKPLLTSPLSPKSLLSATSSSPSARVDSNHPLSHKLSNSGEAVTWRLASPNSRPSNLQDHTFRAPIGYIFFDVFNQNQVQNPIFKSKKFAAKEGEVSTKCLTFWFSPFGRSEVTQLSVYQSVEGSTGDADIGETAPASSGGGSSSGSSGVDGSSGRRILLWQIQTRKFDTRRPQWYFGQSQVNAATPHEITFEGEALDGGFAVDDITFYDGNCQTRPKEASVVIKTEE